MTVISVRFLPVSHLHVPRVEVVRDIAAAFLVIDLATVLLDYALGELVEHALQPMCVLTFL